MPDALEMTWRDTVGLATIQSRKAASAAAMTAALGRAVPDRPVRLGDDAFALVGTGPGAWLAECARPEADWPRDIATRLDGLASVTDQSAAYAIVRLSGPGARGVLQAGAAIDLHPAAFAPGDSASTLIGHINLLFWQVDDGPTFDLLVYRSFASSFHQWLEAAAASL